MILHASKAFLVPIAIHVLLDPCLLNTGDAHAGHSMLVTMSVQTGELLMNLYIYAYDWYMYMYVV